MVVKEFFRMTSLLAAALLGGAAPTLPTKCGGAYRCDDGVLVSGSEPSCVRELRVKEAPQRITIDCDGCCPRNFSWALSHELVPSDKRVSFQLDFLTVVPPPSGPLSLTLAAHFGRRWRSIGTIREIKAGDEVARYDNAIGVTLLSDFDGSRGKPPPPFKVAFDVSVTPKRIISGLDTPRGISTLVLLAMGITAVVLMLARASWIVSYAHAHGMMVARTYLQWWRWFFWQPSLRADMEEHMRSLRSAELKDEEDADAALARCRHGSLEQLGLPAGTQSEQCAVCIEDLGEEKELSVLPCGHAFHSDCIAHWFRFKKAAVRRCPVCKLDTLLTKDDTEDAARRGQAEAEEIDNASISATRRDAAAGTGGNGSATARTAASHDSADRDEALDVAEEEHAVQRPHGDAGHDSVLSGIVVERVREDVKMAEEAKDGEAVRAPTTLRPGSTGSSFTSRTDRDTARNAS